VQTIKTAVVVVLLLFVLYGGYVALNGTDTPLKPELEELVGLETLPDVSGPSGPFVSTSSPNSLSGFESFNSSPPPNFGASASASPFPSSGGSSFPPSKDFETSLPPLSVPSSPSNASESKGLLLPANGSSASGSFPVSANPAPSLGNSIPSLPPLPELSAPSSPTTSQSTPSLPVSTSTPSLSLSTPASKVPAEFASSTTFSPSEPNLSKEVVGSVTSKDDVGQPTTSTESTSSAIKSKSASKSYENAKTLAMEQIEHGNLKEALATLSMFYNAQELTSEQRSDLLDLLDALAREVVYSRRHLLDSVYVVAPGETLSDVSKRYDVPAEILARINAIDTASPLPAGAKLKVVPGPFRAEVDMTRSELTLFLGDLYAGRYPVSFGSDPAPKPGLLQVIDKQRNKNYYGNGVQIPAADPRNPYGGWWIDLGQDICIHGSADGVSESKLGCISLSPLDASDIFGMLGRGSPVTVRR